MKSTSMKFIIVTIPLEYERSKPYD